MTPQAFPYALDMVENLLTTRRIAAATQKEPANPLGLAGLFHQRADLRGNAAMTNYW
jgi:hypothetical protein